MPPKTKNKLLSVQFSLSSQILEKLEGRVEKTGQGRNELVREALVKFLSKKVF